jgi:hypothetical protein
MLATCAVVTVVSAEGTSLGGLPASVKNDIDCAVASLKTVQGVDQVEAGVLNGSISGEASSLTWVHPFIDYRYVDGTGRMNKVRFEAHYGGRKELFLTAILPGLFSAAEKGPSDYGASKAIQIWKARCGLYGNIIFE